MIAHPTTPDQPPALEPLVAELAAYVRQAATAGTPAREAEYAIWTRILAVGRRALGLFFHLQGTGDIGDTVDLADGTTARRLPRTHRRTYRSVFGDFPLGRTAYGTREGQAIALAPLDARLQLPAGDDSYLLQKWDQALGCEAAFARVGATLSDVLGLKQSTGSRERMDRHMAEAVRPFREARAVPSPADEGEVMVAQADGKGIVMRRPADEPPILGHRTRGQKANRRRMAIVGAVYSVGRAVRTPADVVASLFRAPAADRPVGAAPIRSASTCGPV
jgi:hypothetical protein